MARDITTAFNNAIKSTVVQPLFAIELEFSDGTLFDSSASVIADVYTLFKGKMDVLNITESGDTSTISLKIESRLISFEHPLNRLYTLEDQQVDFSSDVGFEFINDLQDKEIIWGKKTQ
jgi:hypothetical protein